MTEKPNVFADLAPFKAEHARRVCSWIDSGETLKNMTGEDTWPASENLILSWQKIDIAAYVLMAEHKPVAYAEVWDRKVDRAVEIGHLVVDPSRRGRGYGTLMLDLLVERAAHRPGIQKVILNFHHGDESVLGCYLKAGFELVGRSSDGEGLRMERKVGVAGDD